MMWNGRRGKSNVEARRNSRRPHHADKQRVEISAVAALGRARPYRIAVAPTGTRLVVAHGGDDEVVDCPRFREWVLESACLLRGQVRDGSVKRDAAVRLKETPESLRVNAGRLLSALVGFEKDAMFVA